MLNRSYLWIQNYSHLYDLNSWILGERKHRKVIEHLSVLFKKSKNSWLIRHIYQGRSCILHSEGSYIIQSRGWDNRWFREPRGYIYQFFAYKKDANGLNMIHSWTQTSLNIFTSYSLLKDAKYHAKLQTNKNPEN